ncbi:Serine/threonine-protein kinase [Blyttiomyces sp. JEL0837]|nr:Serine/threonine-protein kinase [Blyttiomyces sp. JEL0837]
MYIFHGDIKTENILVTSWNWAYLSDYSSFKPIYLPEDNPADFSYFFDTSLRRTCYLAPERFLAPGEILFRNRNGQLNAAMDIFALGCTIAELFLEGTPIFTFSQLLRYRSGEFDPSSALEIIEDDHIKSMIKHMINIDPSQRSSAEFHLDHWRGLAFPEVFYEFLHGYMCGLTDPALAHTLSSQVISRTPTSPPSQIIADPDSKIDRLFHDFPRIAEALNIPSSYEDSLNSMEALGELGYERYRNGGNEKVEVQQNSAPPRRSSGPKSTIFPINVNIPRYSMPISPLSRNSTCGDGCIIIADVVCSSIRNAFFPSSRLMALDLLLALGVQLSDEHRMDRIIPYIVAILNDESSIVRASAIKTLTQLISIFESITTADANIFPEYILPALRRFSSDPDPFVRGTYAQCIATLAETGLKFLELSQLLKNGIGSEADSEGQLYQITYDAALRDLHELVQEEVVALLIDSNPYVKRCLLSDMPRLCIFFGRQRANDVLLSHMITYLNDPDWQLRSAFFESIVGVGTYVGSRSLEEYIMPLTLQALTDSEEFVVEKVLVSLTSLAELGLLQKAKLKELVSTVMPLLCHPNVWIRNGAIAFIACTAKAIPLIDVRCVLYPMIRPFLKGDIPEVTELYMLNNLRNPVSRMLYDQTLNFAAKTPSLSFREQRRMSESSDSAPSDVESGRRGSEVESQDYGSDLSVGWGLGEDVDMKNLGITPHTVFLTPPNYSPANGSNSQSPAEAPRSRNATGSILPLHRVTSESQIVSRPFSPPNKFQTLQRDFRSPSPSNSGYGTPSRVGGAVASTGTSAGLVPGHGLGSNFSDISSEPKPNNPPKSPEPISVPLQSSSHGQSRPARPLSVVSDSSLLQVYQNASDAESVVEKMSVFSLDRLSTDLPTAGKAKASTATVAETAIAKIEGRSATVSAATVTASGTQSSVAAAVVAAAALGTQKAVARAAHGRNDSTGSSVMTMDTAASDARSVGVVGIQRTMSMATTADSKPGNPPVGGNGELIGIANLGGVFAAHLTEHKGPINQIKLAPDHNFFATCSDDGTVKIWDSHRLERNVTNRARLTYAQQGGKIQSIGFCENTHSIASTSDNGTIHISRVEYMSSSTPNGAAKYNGIHVIRTCEVDERDKPMLVEHYDSDADSILVYSTKQGKIRGVDLRSMKTAWSYDSPPHYGVISSVMLDRRSNWILTGTHRGVFSLWDLRFSLRVKSWAHPSRSRVNKLSAASSTMGKTGVSMSSSASISSKMVLAAVGGKTSEVALWDVEAGECKEVWCVFGAASAGRSGVVGAGDPAEEMNRLYGNGLKAVPAPSANDFVPTNSVDAMGVSKAEASVRSFVAPQDAPFLLTAGSDRRIRYSTHQYGDITFNIEYTPSLAFTSSAPSPPRPDRPTGIFPQAGVGTVGSSSLPSSSSSNSSTLGSGGAGLVSSPSIINHLDAINDIVLTQVPYPMAIAGGRDGVVKVWI